MISSTLPVVAALLAAGTGIPDAGVPGIRLIRRTERLDSGRMPSVHVVPGVPLAITFPKPVREDGLLLADALGSFEEPRRLGNGRHILLLPRPTAANTTATLTAVLEDGSLVIVPITGPSNGTADTQVEFESATQAVAATAANDNAQPLDPEPDDTLRALASLVAREEASSPAPLLRTRLRFVARSGDVHFEGVSLWRGLSSGLLVFRVSNRHPDAVFQPLRVALQAEHEGASNELPAALAMEPMSIGPGEEALLAISFRSPNAALGELSVHLTDANGRESSLDGVKP